MNGQFQAYCDGCGKYGWIVQVLAIRLDNVVITVADHRCAACKLDFPLPQHVLAGSECSRCGTWKGFFKRTPCVRLNSELLQAVAKKAAAR